MLVPKLRHERRTEVPETAAAATVGRIDATTSSWRGAKPRNERAVAATATNAGKYFVGTCTLNCPANRFDPCTFGSSTPVGATEDTRLYEYCRGNTRVHRTFGRDETRQCTTLCGHRQGREFKIEYVHQQLGACNDCENRDGFPNPPRHSRTTRCLGLSGLLTLPLRLFHRRYRSPAHPQWCTSSPQAGDF